MKIETWSINRPIPYARNARKISDIAVSKVAASIKEFGFRQPIVVDKDDVVVVGHARLLAAHKLSLVELPVHVADSLSPAQIKAYRLMDNRSHEEAEWDFDLLGPELLELQDMAVDLSLTGFDEDEISGFLATLDATAEGLTDDDDCPEPPASPVTVLGDVWLLGRHRLMCGDSTDIEAVSQLMAGEKGDLCVTDPPYGVSYVGKTKDKLKILNDGMPEVAFAQFLADSYTSLATAVKDGAAVYVFHADTFGHHFRQEFIKAGFHLSGVCIWKKQTIVMGRSDFHWKHEPIL